uniref:nicotinate phosphoribosyltransferase n=1 Tax=Coprococcus sp. TaxID=2049024 RepID=UPI004028450C
KEFHFTGDLYAVPEGTPVFPGEPILTICAPAIEAQIIETFVLLSINHQSLIATKANRIVRAAQGKTVLEFGSRRAQGADGAVLGARAAYLAGCGGTACTLTDSLYGVPAGGTMAHAWVQMFDSEYEAFAAYCKLYPNNAILLVDTYDTLKSGVPNAIRAFRDILVPQGITSFGIRLDSGDLAYLSKKARKMLDAAGYPDAVIAASSDLDEYLINSLKNQGAAITSWGVGTNLITSADNPSFGGVYKLAAIKKPEDEEFTAKIKISENPAKITNPGNKTVFRLYNKETGKIKADLIALSDETYNEAEDLEIFDQMATWKRSTLPGGSYEIREMLVPVFLKGQCVYQNPSTMEIREYCQKELNTLWDETRRLVNPQEVFVDLSKPLYDLKQKLLNSRH